MIVYLENPMSEMGSNCLRNPTEDHVETEFDPQFEQCRNIIEVKRRLQHMEDNGLHIRNGCGMVFRSYNMIKTIEDLEQTKKFFRLLTRTCGLRQTVYSMIMGHPYNEDKE